jgi:hypothetical protein
MAELFKPNNFIHWNVTHKGFPQEGIAIQWIAPDGSQIDGVCVFRQGDSVFGKFIRCVEFLPLRDSEGHERDVPVHYLPPLWRYVSDG